MDAPTDAADRQRIWPARVFTCNVPPRMVDHIRSRLAAGLPAGLAITFSKGSLATSHFPLTVTVTIEDDTGQLDADALVTIGSTVKARLAAAGLLVGSATDTTDPDGPAEATMLVLVSDERWFAEDDHGFPVDSQPGGMVAA